jgi:hypothetical protein
LYTLKGEVITLSEQAKVAFIQEKIRNARHAIASSAQVLGIGIVLAILGFMLSSILIALAIIGVVLTVSAGASYFYFIDQSRKLTLQLKEMASALSSCPRCGKELPKGAFSFCPFCGTPLEYRQ